MSKLFHNTSFSASTLRVFLFFGCFVKCSTPSTDSTGCFRSELIDGLTDALDAGCRAGEIPSRGAREGVAKPSVAIALGVEGIMGCSLGGQGVPGALLSTSLWCTMAENWIPGSRPSLGAWVGVEATDGVFEYGSLSAWVPSNKSKVSHTRKIRAVFLTVTSTYTFRSSRIFQHIPAWLAAAAPSSRLILEALEDPPATDMPRPSGT